mmetsp:Transcript_81545/g.264175  ORF Transcript_81545/g.264175 Transcript_81545/m.264175 type:complete len:244 (+) Transcript_81545:482-1213(+)
MGTATTRCARLCPGIRGAGAVAAAGAVTGAWRTGRPGAGTAPGTAVLGPTEASPTQGLGQAGRNTATRTAGLVVWLSLLAGARRAATAGTLTRISRSVRWHPRGAEGQPVQPPPPERGAPAAGLQRGACSSARAALGAAAEAVPGAARKEAARPRGQPWQLPQPRRGCSVRHGERPTALHLTSRATAKATRRAATGVAVWRATEAPAVARRAACATAAGQLATARPALVGPGSRMTKLARTRS